MMWRMRGRWLGWILLAAGAALAHAQEFSATGGVMGTGGAYDSSYAWELEFRHDLGPHAAWTINYLNEGHARTHHRDGVAGQFWLTLPLSHDRFAVSAGAGAYHYFDTRLYGENGSANVHGWAPLYSFAVTYYTDSRWFFRATANRVNRAHGLASNTLLFGAGLWLGRVETTRASRPPLVGTTTANEFTVYGGRSIVNTAESPTGAASAVEFRQGISKNFDWSATWLNEGDARVTRRNGLALQGWLVGGYLHDRVTLGLGVGGYLFFDRPDTGSADRSRHDVAALVSPTASYRLGEHWLARVVWHRVISDYHRDADLLLVGLGYRWGG
jgi:hypothetical protein